MADREDNGRRLFKPPPHPHEAEHQRFLARVAAMTPEQFFQTLVDTGIYRPDGQLAPEYGGPADPTSASSGS